MSFCSVFLLFTVHSSWSLSSAGLLAGKVTVGVGVGVGEVLLEEVEEGAVLLEEVEEGEVLLEEVEEGAVLLEEVKVGSGAVLLEEVEVGAHKHTQPVHVFRLSRTLNSCDTPYTSTRLVDRSSCTMCRKCRRLHLR